VKITPQERPGLEVSREFLDETTSCLRKHVHEMKPELFFNLDEAGMSEREDRKEKKTIVAMTTDNQTISRGAPRSVRHTSVIAYISAGGESLTPFIVRWQIWDGIRKKPMGRRVRLGVDLVLRQ
jgi:hypothetical protein